MKWKVDFISQLAITSLVVGLRRSSKALLQVKLAPKRGHGHCLVVCCRSDPAQLSESWQNYIWEVRSANWQDALKTATPAASIGPQKGPTPVVWYLWKSLFPHLYGRDQKSTCSTRSWWGSNEIMHVDSAWRSHGMVPSILDTLDKWWPHNNDD